MSRMPSDRTSNAGLPTWVQRITNSEWFWPSIVTAVFLTTSIVLHLRYFTMFSYPDDMWEKMMRAHEQYYPFSARVFTTSLVRFLNVGAGLSLRISFGLVQYMSLGAMALVFYHYLRTLGFSRWASSIGLALLMGSYSIQCAFFEPVFTWDDVWLYMAVPLAFMLMVTKRVIASAVVFAFGTVARETTIFFYPVLLYLALTQQNDKRIRFWLALLFPLITAVGYQWLMSPVWDLTMPHMYSFNFQDAATASNVAYSLLVCFGVLWITLLLTLVLMGSDLTIDNRYAFLVFGAVVTLPLFFITTLTLARARETRLFFPPFVFVVPLTLLFWQKYGRSIVEICRRWRGVPVVLLAVSAIWIGQIAAAAIFPSLEYRTSIQFSQAYLGAHLALAIMLLVPLVILTFRSAYRSGKQRPG